MSEQELESENETNFRRLRTNFKRYPRIQKVLDQKPLKTKEKKKEKNQKSICCQSDI